jgi:membrane dipeptidase
MPAGMEDASKFPQLTEGLLKRGYGEAGIRKILGLNTVRVMSDAQRVGELIHAEKH